jgi:hypothetical protein
MTTPMPERLHMTILLGELHGALAEVPPCDVCGEPPAVDVWEDDSSGTTCLEWDLCPTHRPDCPAGVAVTAAPERPTLRLVTRADLAK